MGLKLTSGFRGSWFLIKTRFQLSKNLINQNSLLLILISLSLSFSAYAQGKKEVYSVGIYDNPPISFINANGKPDGYVVELLTEISKQDDFKINWVFDKWQNIIEKIKTNKIDMITSVAYSETRSKYMTYSQNNFVVGWSQIFLPIDSEIENFIDLNNKTIAILKGGINGEALKKRCIEFDLKCNLIEVQTYEEAFKKLSNKQVDATVSNNSVGIWYTNKYKITLSSIIFNPTKGFVTIPKNNQSKWLLDKFDERVSAWKKNANSFYFHAKDNWLNPQYKVNYSSKIIYSIIALTLLSVLGIISALVFKRQVARRVKDISIRNQQFSQIINLVPHIIYVVDEKGNILLANIKANKYFGMTKDEIKKCNIENFNIKKYSEIEFLNDHNLSKKLDESDLKELKTTDYIGNNYTLLLTKMPFKGLDHKNKAHVIVAVDITEIKEYQQKITHMAHYHQLSNLPNRTLFKNEIEKSIAQFKKHKKYGSLLYIDLDSFKNINDSQGHKVGDLLILALVNRFKIKLPENNFIAHLGGDEFIIDCSELHTEDTIAEILAMQYSELVLEIISKPITVKNVKYEITASIGLVVYPRDGDTEEVLFQRADTALNKAKKMGRNNVQIFDKKLELQVQYNQRLESELRNAFKNSEFKMVYQPIMEAKTRKIVGAEALLRWNHPIRGIIGPAEFIAVAENNHLIIDLGYWILEQAYQRIKQHIDAGDPEFFIAVNVSVVQLKDKSFYKRVLEMVQKYAIPPNHLELELTESVLMEDVEFSISIFNKLKLLGIKISIDDFGTGYSSFNYLMKLPIDKLKIDQSFVTVLPMDQNSATIVRTIIKMAKELKLKVVAEGIENQQQFDFLIEEDCQYFQGYFIHRPMDHEKIAKLI